MAQNDVSYFKVEGDSTLYTFNDPDTPISVNGVPFVGGLLTLDADHIDTDDGSTIQSHLGDIESAANTLSGTVSQLQTDVDTAETNIASLQDDVSELLTFEALHLTGSISSTAMYLTDSRITADMRVLECTFGTPSNVTSDLTWTTTAGQITFSGTVSEATTIDLILGKTN